MLRPVGLLLAGFVAGCALTAAFAGRYTVVTAGAGSQFPVIHAYRLNRWSGEVIGVGGQASAKCAAESISAGPALPAFDPRQSFTFEEATNANPYLSP